MHREEGKSDSGPIILVVDDESASRTLLRTFLEREGYEVLEAQDGRAAVKLFERWRPAIVVMDLVMPERDGIEALQDMRKINRGAVIMTMTGGEESNSQAARLLGAKRTFFKPLDPREVVEAVRRELAVRPPMIR